MKLYRLATLIITAVVLAGCTETKTGTDAAASDDNPTMDPVGDGADPGESEGTGANDPADTDAEPGKDSGPTDSTSTTETDCGHRIDPAIVKVGYNRVVDADGQNVQPAGRPSQEGYRLVESETYVEDHNEREFAEIFSYTGAIRDALMCDLANLDLDTWHNLTNVLTINNIRTHQDLSGARNEHVYSTDGIYEHLMNDGPDLHPMMKYLEESELELKCLAFQNFNFTNPEGENHCEMHNLDEGSGYTRP